MLTNDNVLVTGGAGFVGASLTEELAKRGFGVHLLVRSSTNLWRIKHLIGQANFHIHNIDLSNEKKVASAARKIGPKFIFHLATWGAYPAQQNPFKMIETNIVGTMNLLSALETINYQNLIVAGSSSEYGKKAKPMQETDILEPDNYYGATKAAQSLLVSSWSKQNNKASIILRFFSVYGPEEEEGRLVRNVINAALTNEPIKLATGHEARDFIYIDDVVEACFAAMKEKTHGEIFNVGTGVQTTTETLAKTIVELTKSKSQVRLNTYPGRVFDSFNWVADTIKAKRELKFEAKHDLASGLKKTIKWYEG